MPKQPSTIERFAAETSAALYVSDAAGRCTHVNRRFCHIFGLPRRRLLGMGWTDSVHPRDLERVLAARGQALGDVEAFEIRYRVMRKGEKAVWVRANSVALYDPGGKFIGRIGSLTELRSLGPRSRRAVEEVLQSSLTAQEARVLGPLAEGKTNTEIAATLGLSRHTVKNYLSHAFGKLGVKRRSQAAALFARIRDQKAGGDGRPPSPNPPATRPASVTPRRRPPL